jgi:L-ascorbate metabolism protein UlaG (beta-lactamase superfamily)
MATTITRVTHPCVLLDFDGQALLTDPWFSEKPGYRRGEPPALTQRPSPFRYSVIRWPSSTLLGSGEGCGEPVEG